MGAHLRHRLSLLPLDHRLLLLIPLSFASSSSSCSLKFNTLFLIDGLLICTVSRFRFISSVVFFTFLLSSFFELKASCLRSLQHNEQDDKGEGHDDMEQQDEERDEEDQQPTRTKKKMA